MFKSPGLASKVRKMTFASVVDRLVTNDSALVVYLGDDPIFRLISRSTPTSFVYLRIGARNPLLRRAGASSDRAQWLSDRISVARSDDTCFHFRRSLTFSAAITSSVRKRHSLADTWKTCQNLGATS